MDPVELKIELKRPPTEMRHDPTGWWPNHVKKMFAAIGNAMDGKRLTPETLERLPTAFGSILPDHQVTVRHVSGKEHGRRKGIYVITVDGHPLGGRWQFTSGELEGLSRDAAREVMTLPKST
jgi:hypothetical protein